MKKSILKLEAFTSSSSVNSFRTIIKTKHGRILFLALEFQEATCTITNCFYTDRNQGKTGVDRYQAKPLKLQKFQFSRDRLLSVIEVMLDKKFYGIEYIKNETMNLTLDEYLQTKENTEKFKYRFLIMVGDGELCNGLPARLRTRLKNKLHRAIYIELAYYKDGKGVVQQCCYYDRKYQRQNITITPSMLISCFFPYTHEGILNLLNHEICCDFTHMIITDDINLDSNMTPLCGAI